MKKEEITALGVSEELAQRVADVSAEELKGYVPKARFDEVNEAKKKAEAMLTDRDKQLEELRKSAGDNEDLKNQIAELQRTNAATVKQHEVEMRQLRRDGIDSQLIMAAGAKNPKTVAALFEALDDKLDEEAYRAARQKQVDEIKKNNDYLFISEQPTIDGIQPVPGADVSPGPVDVSAMTYSQLTEYLEKNPGATF
nr:MAG TPA: minor structural protein [Caudoviricetes sp.]